MSNVSDSISVEQAASVLGVSPRQVRALVAADRLPASRVGPMWLVNAEAVRARARQAPPAGRPLSPEAAWSLLRVVDALLDAPGRPDVVADVWRAIPDRQVRHRLRRLLANPRSAARWRQSLSGRAQRLPLWVHPGVRQRMADDARLRLGGAAAAARYAVEAASPEPRCWYIEAEDLDAVRRDYQFQEDRQGELEFMVIPAQVPIALRPEPGQPVPLAVALADMLDAPDARQRHAAVQRFESLHLVGDA